MACGSGTKAVQIAAEQIVLGNAEVVVAGGQEAMSRTPYLLDRMRTGYRMGDATVYDGMYRDGFLDPLCGLIMGETAENLARRYEISREEQDEFALHSQQKAADARPAGQGDRADRGAGQERPTVVDRDEHPRPDTTLEGLAKLKPVFGEGGTVTAGNSSGITDGAAAMVVMSESRARRRGGPPWRGSWPWRAPGSTPRTWASAWCRRPARCSTRPG